MSAYVSRRNIPLENAPLYNTLRTITFTHTHTHTHTHTTRALARSCALFFCNSLSQIQHTHTHTFIVDNMGIEYMGAVALRILHVNIWVCHYVNSIKFCNCLCGERERRASRTGRDGQSVLWKKNGRITRSVALCTQGNTNVFVSLFFAVRGYGQVDSEGRKTRNSICFLEIFIPTWQSSPWSSLDDAECVVVQQLIVTSQP